MTGDLQHRRRTLYEAELASRGLRDMPGKARSRRVAEIMKGMSSFTGNSHVAAEKKKGSRPSSITGVKNRREGSLNLLRRRGVERRIPKNQLMSERKKTSFDQGKKGRVGEEPSIFAKVKGRRTKNQS